MTSGRPRCSQRERPGIPETQSVAIPRGIKTGFVKKSRQFVLGDGVLIGNIGEVGDDSRRASKLLALMILLLGNIPWLNVGPLMTGSCGTCISAKYVEWSDRTVTVRRPRILHQE